MSSTVFSYFVGKDNSVVVLSPLCEETHGLGDIDDEYGVALCSVNGTIRLVIVEPNS